MTLDPPPLPPLPSALPFLTASHLTMSNLLSEVMCTFSAHNTLESMNNNMGVCEAGEATWDFLSSTID